jgi:hypothetical protein
MGRAFKRPWGGKILFCFLEMMWYYRGNVVHIQSKEKEAQNHSWFFGTPGHSYGPSRPFSPQGKGKEETRRLKGF